MLEFILNKLFTKRVIKQEVSKRTYIRKEVGERKAPTIRTRFNLAEVEKTELYSYFSDSKGLNLKARNKITY